MSLLGVPGLFDLYRAGKVTLVNAPGTGIADDKAIYAYVPEIIEFYTGEKPILNNVPTFRCAVDDECTHVLDNLHELVVKEVHGSGGYGMLIGPHASKIQRREFATRIRHVRRLKAMASVHAMLICGHSCWLATRSASLPVD